MFLGQYEHTIDDKGRLTIPARYRDLLPDGAYVTQGFDRNLIVLPPALYEQLSKRISSLSLTEPSARLLRRLMFSSAEKVDVDKSGRILIPLFLRQNASLETAAMVVGSGDFFEIWSPAEWAGQSAKLKDADANAERFAGLDLSAL
jgi:MraZ protein